MTGRVIDWSAAPRKDERNGAVFYEVTIAADSPRSAAAPPDLVPGMAVEAFLVTTPRTVLSFVGRAVSDYFARALREG